MDVILKTKENFEEFYKTDYKNKIDSYYKKITGKKIKLFLVRAIVMIALYVIIFLLCEFFKVKQQIEISYYYTGVILCLLFVLISTIISIYKSFKCENRKLNEYIIEDIIAFVSDSNLNEIKFERKSRLSKESFEKMELFNLDTVNYDGRNFISANYNGNDMFFSDIDIFTLNEVVTQKDIYKDGKKYIRTTKKKVRNHIFKGIYIGAKLNKKISDYIYLIPNNIKDSFIQKNINKYVKYRGNKINLENLEFSKKYKVYSEDEVQARYILSLSLMEKINKIDNLFDGKKYIVFKEGRRFSICIENFSIESLDNNCLPVIRNKVKELKVLAHIFEQINKLFEIYHILDLDNDLYVKNINSKKVKEEENIKFNNNKNIRDKIVPVINNVKKDNIEIKKDRKYIIKLLSIQGKIENDNNKEIDKLIKNKIKELNKEEKSLLVYNTEYILNEKQTILKKEIILYIKMNEYNKAYKKLIDFVKCNEAEKIYKKELKFIKAVLLNINDKLNLTKNN